MHLNYEILQNNAVFELYPEEKTMKFRTLRTANISSVRSKAVTRSPDEPIRNKDYWLIESRLLNGEVIVYAKYTKYLKKLRALLPELVIYFPPEADELYKHKDDKEHIIALHKLKKKFRGWLVPQK